MKDCIKKATRIPHKIITPTRQDNKPYFLCGSASNPLTSAKEFSSVCSGLCTFFSSSFLFRLMCSRYLCFPSSTASKMTPFAFAFCPID